jgi:hypothetical protein
MALHTLRPLSFGEILDGAFTLYRRNFVTFVLTALIPTVAIGVVFLALGGGMMASAASGDTSGYLSALMGAGLVVMVVAFGGMLLMWGALTREASQAYTGQPITVGDGLQAGARAILPLLGSGVLAFVGAMLAALGVGLVLMIVIAFMAALGGATAVLGMLLAFLGWVGFILAAIAVLFAVTPAVVVEGAGPLEALERSYALARGALGRVIGLMCVTVLITYLPTMAVMAMTGGFAQMMNPETLPTTQQLVTQQLLGLAVTVLTTPFMVSVIVLLYFDRRVRTEALDVQMMADRLAVAGD